MSNFQDEESYKSLIKTFSHYAQKLVQARNRPDLELEDASDYLSDLVMLSPAIVNLSKELETFYDSTFDIDYSQIIGNVGKIEDLVSKISSEVKHNVHFRNIPLAFELESAQLENQFNRCFDYTQSNPQDYFEDKSMYWLFNGLIAADSTITDLCATEENRMWNSIAQSDIATLVASKIKPYHDTDSEEDADYYIQDLEIGIFDTCMDIINNRNQIHSNILEELLDNYRQNCQEVDIEKDNYAEVFSPFIPEVEKIIERHKQVFQRLDDISNITDDFHQKIWDYDADSISEIIDYQLAEKSAPVSSDLLQLDFKAEDFNELLADQSYQPLIEETCKEYKQYQERQIDLDNFEQRKITNTVLNTYFSAILKIWAGNTANKAGLYCNKAFDIAAGIKDNSSLQEQVETRSAMLETAKDIVLIGRISSEFIYDIDEQHRRKGIRLVENGIGLEYVEEMIKHPNNMKKSDYESLGVLLEDYCSHCSENYAQLQLGKDEHYIQEDMNGTDFSNALDLEPPSRDKYRYTYYAERISEVNKLHAIEELGKNGQIFSQLVSPFYANEYKNLKDYIKEGDDLFPQLKKFDVLGHVEKIVHSLVLIPRYSGQPDFSDAEWGEYLHNSFSDMPLDEVSSDFIKSAANGYRRQVMVRYPKLKYDPFVNQKISKLAKEQVYLNECWAVDYHSGLALKTSKGIQEDYIEEMKRLQSYRQSRHPAHDPITKMILNFRKNTK